jgi:hypothetical protein
LQAKRDAIRQLIIKVDYEKNLNDIACSMFRSGCYGTTGTPQGRTAAEDAAV